MKRIRLLSKKKQITHDHQAKYLRAGNGSINLINKQKIIISTMKNMTINLVCMTLVFLFATATGCKKDVLRGNGNKVSEQRAIGSFNKIYTSGSAPVYITYGQNFSVRITGSENLVAEYLTDVANGELRLGYGNIQIRKDDVELHITAPVVERVIINGSARIQFLGDFPSQNEFAGDISGSGEVNVNGNMKSVFTKFNISGSGRATMQNLISTKAELKISGSGDIYNTVSEDLMATISGSGNIYYSGNPILHKTMSGSGKIIKN